MTPSKLFHSALIAALTLSLALPLPASGASVTSAAAKPDATARLAVRGGEDAILALGDGLPSVARAYGRSAERLRRQLREERHLRVDGNGRLLYVDAAPAATPAAAPAATDPPARIISALTGETFGLHSNPGSKRVLYLDFDGHFLTGTAWNAAYIRSDLTCPAWDIDGNPATFGTDESSRIRDVWARVAEDYAPFDVDVTTEYPGEDAITRTSSADDVFGMRVLVSPISSYVGPYGGVSYVGVFDMASQYYKPSLVFPENLGNNAKYIAEAISHEAGHSLGLSHDGVAGGAEYYAGHGTGVTGWAPIMGSGYSRNLTQWSRGEYANASNTEDDLSVISSNGAVLLPDDAAGTDAAAVSLASSATAYGLIGATGDTDSYVVSTGGGTLTASLSVSSIGPNVDTAIDLVDATGAILATASSPDVLGATVTSAVGGGTYYLRVRGVGKADPITGYSNYASLGLYKLTVSAPAAAGQPPIVIAGATPPSGPAPLSVQFSSAGTADADGAIASYRWDFGDGTSSTEPDPGHVYQSAGTYTARLTVTDSSGLSASTSILVTADEPANLSPVAALTASVAEGIAPLSVAFDGSGSSDPDGAIVSWAWSFGDGTSATGATVSHVYTTAGTYTARLVVTDDRGSTSASTVTVTVRPAADRMHVGGLTLALIKSNRGTQVKGSVRVVDAYGAPVPSATVTAKWSGRLTATVTGITDANGYVTFSTKAVKTPFTMTLSVASVSKTSWTYDASANVATSATISAAAPAPSQALR